MRWPFQQWGASAVLSGHEHDYERVTINDFPYFVNGLGGRSLYNFGTPISGSVVRYNADYGGQLVTADDDSIVFAFYSRTSALIDRYVIRANRTYAVNDGWNMESLPLTVSDPRTTVVYPSGSSSAFAFDQTAGYVARDTLKNGEGFWLKFSSAQNVSITGTVRVQDSIMVRAGWNLIGSISNPVVANSIVQIPTGIIASNYFGYNGAYTPADTLKSGKGYWVKVNQNGKLVLR
jgi:hypothetical protein